MALTIQQNGQFVGGQKNTIMASWFNDYHDLLTGIMRDQPVTLRTGVAIEGIQAAPTFVGTLALAAGTALGVGVYKYVITWLDGSGGESLASPSTSITTTTGNQVVSITGLTTGGSGITGRRLYRTAVGGSVFYLLATINDNTTTSYSDSATDASINTNPFPPSHSSVGALFIKDATGLTNATFYNDGTLSLAGTVISGGYPLPRMRTKGGYTPGQNIWVAPTGTDPTTGDGLVEGDIVFSL